MRRSKFSPQKIVQILKEFDNGKSVEEVSRAHAVNVSTFYKWRSKNAGMGNSDIEAQIAEVYGFEVYTSSISRITYVFRNDIVAW